MKRTREQRAVAACVALGALALSGCTVPASQAEPFATQGSSPTQAASSTPTPSMTARAHAPTPPELSESTQEAVRGALDGYVDVGDVYVAVSPPAEVARMVSQTWDSDDTALIGFDPENLDASDQACIDSHRRDDDGRRDHGTGWIAATVSITQDASEDTETPEDVGLVMPNFYVQTTIFPTPDAAAAAWADWAETDRICARSTQAGPWMGPPFEILEDTDRPTLLKQWRNDSTPDSVTHRRELAGHRIVHAQLDTTVDTAEEHSAHVIADLLAALDTRAGQPSPSPASTPSPSRSTPSPSQENDS
ncbi:MAG: hypothetical protein Q4G34_09285 [Micrococcus sp.]|nr:hypothetical protein [Micrococcus sp.]